MTARDTTTERPAPAFERRDAPPRGVAYAVLGLFAGVLISALFVAALLYALQPEPRTAAVSMPQEPQQPSQTPPLEVTPAADGAAVQARAEEMLHGYAWIDRQSGIARIPIERAMELTVERGWPDDAGKGKR
jgi:hypothetical protein